MLYIAIRKLEGPSPECGVLWLLPDSALLVNGLYDTNVIMWDPYTHMKCTHCEKDLLSLASASWWVDGWETCLGARCSVVLPVLRHWYAAVFVSGILKWAPSAFKSPVIRGHSVLLGFSITKPHSTLSFHLLITVVQCSECDPLIKTVISKVSFQVVQQLGLLFPLSLLFSEANNR